MDAANETPRLFTWLARFHAHFWGPEMAECRSKYLKNGGWWRKQLRPTVKWDNLLPTYLHLASQFPNEFALLRHEQAQASLLQLTALAKADCFLKALGAPNTLIHGDVKTCNFFPSFANDDVIAIDFQWTGNASSGVADIVYFFYGGVTSFSEDIEEP